MESEKSKREKQSDWLVITVAQSGAQEQHSQLRTYTVCSQEKVQSRIKTRSNKIKHYSIFQQPVISQPAGKLPGNCREMASSQK